MSVERRRQLGSFFGLFMLAVQLFVLYRFVQIVLTDVDVTQWTDRESLFIRMAWLKAAPWSVPWFERYFRAFALTCAWIAGTLLVLGVLRWVRGAHAAKGLR